MSKLHKLDSDSTLKVEVCVCVCVCVCVRLNVEPCGQEWGVELNDFLTSALIGGEWSTSFVRHFTPRKGS